MPLPVCLAHSSSTHAIDGELAEAFLVSEKLAATQLRMKSYVITII